VIQKAASVDWKEQDAISGTCYKHSRTECQSSNLFLKADDIFIQLLRKTEA